MPIPISNVTRRVVYAASGTGPYSFTFEILAASDIAVYEDDTLLTLTTDYTVTINANGTGSVTLVASPTGTQIAIVGNRTIARATDFTTGGDFFANTLNDELDQQTIFAQQNQEALQRALTAPQTDPTSINMVLPRAATRANKTLAFDSDGNPVIGEIIGDNRGNWSAGVAYNKRDIVKDTSNNNIYLANTAHTSSGSQPISTNADAAKWDLLVDAAAATSSASAASTSETNAANSAADAEKLAINAEDASFTLSDGVTTGYSALHHKEKALDAQTAAESAKTDAETAQTAAENAQAYAEEWANKAEDSLISTAAGGNGSTEYSALHWAAKAADSEAAATAIFANFNNAYLGAKTSDPSVDNDGNALTDGDLYFDTTNNIMKVYDLATTTWLRLTPTSVNQSNINTVAGIAADVTAVAGVAANVTTVAGISANVTTVAGVNADVTTVAGISGNVTTVANNDANVTTVATNNANITTVAGDIANVNAVAGIAANVTTVAGIAANVTTVAGLNSEVSALGAIASDITTAATNIVDISNFADVYYGPSASAPSTRADSSALQVGDLYFDTVSDTMKVYGSGGWAAAGSTVNGTAARFNYTATASQTTFSGADANGNTLAYDAGYLDVYLNGVKLLNGTDFTASSGTSIVLASGAALNDVLEIVAYGTFSLASFSIGDANDVSIAGISSGQVLQWSGSSFTPATPVSTGKAIAMSIVFGG